MTDIAQSLDRIVAERRLLDHPFYKAWAAGTLTRDDLAFYSTQYWRQVEAFPGYLGTLAERLPGGAARAIVTDNLADELDDDHPGMWRDFAGGLGVDSAALEGAGIEPETEACVEAFSDAAARGSIPYALGMLYAYESQTPEVATTKAAGLREHYGLEDKGIAYFDLHAVVDVEHTRELGRALLETTDGDLGEAEEGAAAGAEAVWGLLDGVARVRGIA